MFVYGVSHGRSFCHVITSAPAMGAQEKGSHTQRPLILLVALRRQALPPNVTSCNAVMGKHPTNNKGCTWCAPSLPVPASLPITVLAC